MTVAERVFQDRVRGLGCIACLVSLDLRTDGDIHHILSGGRRIGELSVLCLCVSHHRSGLNSKMFVSRHPWKSRFEAAYGTETELLVHTKRLIAAYLP